jgi:transcription-repair coupling factor (superfamily II helicase)
MSIIATPPEDRRGIGTFMVKFDPAQIREAILREIQRGLPASLERLKVPVRCSWA